MLDSISAIDITILDRNTSILALGIRYWVARPESFWVLGAMSPNMLSGGTSRAPTLASSTALVDLQCRSSLSAILNQQWSSKRVSFMVAAAAHAWYDFQTAGNSSWSMLLRVQQRRTEFEFWPAANLRIDRIRCVIRTCALFIAETKYRCSSAQT